MQPLNRHPSLETFSEENEMNAKSIGFSIVGVLLIVIAFWILAITSYEEELGTENTFVAYDLNNNLTSEKNEPLIELAFSEAEEGLEWSKISVSIDNGTEKMDCSKSGYTSNNIEEEKVVTRLNSDGVTFSVVIDATSEENFTYVDLDNLEESDDSDFDLRFSKTDIYLSENIVGTIVEDVEFEELVEVPDQNFTENSDERLDWYDYNLVAHRVEVENKIYVINIEDRFYKIRFISYYNEDDEERYVSFLIGALNGTEFPALSNPNLVLPAKCIIVEGVENNFWEREEAIMIYENDFDICSAPCTIKITITYEGVSVRGTQEIEIE